MRKHVSIPALAVAVAFATLLLPSAARATDAAPVLKEDSSWKMDFSAIDMLAVQEGGRKKPFQTLAYETMEQIMGRPLIGSTFTRVPVPGTGDAKNDPKTVAYKATDLYLSIAFYPEYWHDKPLVLISHSLRKKLGISLDPAPGVWRDEKRVSLRELENSAIMKLVQELKAKPDEEMDELEKETQLVYRDRMNPLFGIMLSDTDKSMLTIVPHPSDLKGSWVPMSLLEEAVAKVEKEPTISFAFPIDNARTTIKAYKDFKSAYMARDAALFTQAATLLHARLRTLSPAVYPAQGALQVEVNYNNARPFVWAYVFYLFAAILALAAIRFPQKSVYLTALGFYLVGLCIHIYGFGLRCYIAGRPPVTNMYESVVWVGFGVVLFGLILELIYKRRLYLLAGAFGGFLCLVVMDMLPVMLGHTTGTSAAIKPLEPVLRDNFWLLIHVLTITLGYAAFMLAWGMGHISLWSHLIRPGKRNEHVELHTLVYRAVQIGVLLLATGTILGGVWAYYSWGRFWGWDPKETWAFIALMSYIVVLHGRFAGLWTNFGLAFGSVFCFLSVVMAWYGVNFVLGTGKHAYGSGTGGLEAVMTLVAIDLTFLSTASWQYLVHRYKQPPHAAYGLLAAALMGGGGWLLLHVGATGVPAWVPEWNWLQRILTNGKTFGAVLFYFAALGVIWGIPGLVMMWRYRVKQAALANQSSEVPQPAAGE